MGMAGMNELAAKLVAVADQVEGVSTGSGTVPAWVTQFLVTVAASLVIAAVIGMWKSASRRLDQLDIHANQLTDLQGTAKAFVASMDALRGEIRALRVDTLTRAELARVARILHPDFDAEELTDLIGEHPTFTVEQAREMARRRAEQTGPDNPEVHQ